MSSASGSNPVLALGELRGLLAAFAWVNHKCDHFCTFTVEELSSGAELQESLNQHFGTAAMEVSAVQIGDWNSEVGDAFLRWLFRFRDLVKPDVVCALTDERSQREIVATIMNAFTAGLQSLEVWRVKIKPREFYELRWDDFAIRGSSGLFLLHLGVSD